jgi:uncharacterized protein YndB with AHSA1/START domain
MKSPATNIEDMTLDLTHSVEINASPEKVWPAVLHQLGKGNTRPDGVSMQLDLEPHAGGRWYRDRGNGVGHLWGFVQAIKPNELLELSGPLFMSYPAINHIEVKVQKSGAGSKVTLRHRAFGMLDPEHKKGVTQGWNHMLQQMKKASE